MLNSLKIKTLEENKTKSTKIQKQANIRKTLKKREDGVDNKIRLSFLKKRYIPKGPKNSKYPLSMSLVE